MQQFIYRTQEQEIDVCTINSLYLHSLSVQRVCHQLMFFLLSCDQTFCNGHAGICNDDV